MSKVGKYILFFIAGLFLLLTALLFYTQTASFREKVKIQLIKIVESQLDLDLEIEKLDGNLFNNITLKNIKFSKNDSTVAALTSLKINYKLIPVTNKIINIDSLIFENPQINLWQNSDSSWSFNEFVKVSEKADTKENKPFDYSIKLGYLHLKNGNISTQSFSKLIPAKTQNLNLIANGSYSTNQQRIQLKKLNFETKDPALVLTRLSGVFKQNSNGIQLDSLRLITTGSAADLNGKYVSTENLESNIEAGNIDKNEIAIFIPSIKLNCSPSLKANFKTVNDSVSAQVELQYNNESVVAKLALNSLSDLLNKTEPLPYFAHLSFNQFKVENWMDIADNHVLIDGEIKVNGTNLFNYESNAKIDANLKHSEYNQIPFHTLRVNGVYSNNSLNARVKVGSDFGNVLVIGKLWNISKTPRYDGYIKTDDFNVTAFFPELEGTKINGTIQAKGRGFEVDKITAQASLNLINSKIYNYPVDTLNAQVHLQKMEAKIDSFQVHVPGVFASGGGDFNIDSLTIRSVIYADIDSLTVLDSILVLPLEFESAKTRATLSGPVSALQIGGDVEIYNVEGYSVKLEKASGKYKVSLAADALNVWVKTNASGVETGPVSWDTVKVEMNYSETDVDLDVNAIWKDTINARATTQIKMGDTLSFIVPEFEVKTLLSTYFLDDTMRISLLKQDIFEIEKLRLKDRGRPDFILSLNGIISTADTNRFELLVNQLDLSQFNQFIDQTDSLKGIFSTDFSMSGTSANPKIEGVLTVDNPQFGDYSLSAVSAHFNYFDQNGFAEIKTPDMKEFYAGINAPFSAYFDSLEFIFTPPDTFNANLIIDSLQISETLGKMIPNDEIRGVVNANINARGNYENPLFYGDLDIINGHYLNKELGVNYDKIKASAVFDGKKITLDTVQIRQKSGLISITGGVEFDSTIVKGNIISSSMTADANNFFITQHRNYEVLIDAKTFVRTGDKNPEFGGKIKVIRSDVFLPAFMSDGKNIDENDIPMLVEAVYPKPDSLSLKIKTEKQISRSEKMKAALLDNLTGKLNVEIPRNTWIKSDDMRIELRGDVDIVKTGAYFELFGNIDIVRGQYILYGKKLKIKESQIIFQGGEAMDPNLNFNAEYVYRGSDKQKRYLELNINGKISEPEIKFLLDGSEITETDGISILIFGATSDEIGYSGQNRMIGAVGSNALASVVASKLSKTLGTQLKLDMIEVTATENWQSAAFMVGKYITNDIFVMYERGFGEAEGDEITPETIIIEYELSDKIFLRLQSGSSKTSGVDVILKLEKKKKE